MMRLNTQRIGDEMDKYRVSFTVALPENLSVDEVKRFIEFEIGATRSCTLGGELKKIDLQSCNVTNVDVREI